MRSAYLVLGVPGNATPEEIEAAFRRTEAQFPRERLAEEEGALARLQDLRTAYQVLRDPAARAAHDRKLQETARPVPRSRTVIVEAEGPSPMRRMLVYTMLLAALLFGAASYANWRSAELRREQAALELAARKQAAETAQRQREDEERLAAQRAEQARVAEANERRLVLESSYAAARADSARRSQEAAVQAARRQELYEQQRRESARLDEDRRAAQEARLRTERDKQRIRELCYQNYRRADC
jgi:curved DNA-binding protein CbpA